MIYMGVLPMNEGDFNPQSDPIKHTVLQLKHAPLIECPNFVMILVYRSDICPRGPYIDLILVYVFMSKAKLQPTLIEMMMKVQWACVRSAVPIRDRREHDAYENGGSTAKKGHDYFLFSSPKKLTRPICVDHARGG